MISQQEMREALYKLLGNEYFDNYMGEIEFSEVEL